MTFAKVTGDETLVRDMNTHAIINTDKTGYQSYLERKERAQSQKQLINKQFEEIDTLKREMTEIKSMLTELLKGK